MSTSFLQEKISKLHEKFFPNHDASIEFLSLALAGEVGEFCNLLKKSIRGDFKLEDQQKEFLYELADIQIYLKLLFYYFELDEYDIQHLLLEKLDIVEKRITK